MSNTGREQLSDDWSDTFDDGVGANGADFPCAGYGWVLSTVIEEGLGVGPRQLLDLGYDTGTLLAAVRARSDDSDLWGLDRSVNLLERAHGKMPAANLV